MRIGVWLLGLLAMFAVLPAVAEEWSEPPRVYQLSIDGLPLEIEAGKPASVLVGGRQVTVQLEVKPYRKFNRLGVSFDFPEAFAFSVDDEDENVTICTMDKGDHSLMLQMFHLDLLPKQLSDILVPSIKEQYTQLEVTEGPVQLIARQQTFDGTRLTMQLGQVELVQDVYTFANKGGVFALILQDARQQAGEPSRQYLQMLELLKKSLTIGQAKVED